MVRIVAWVALVFASGLAPIARAQEAPPAKKPSSPHYCVYVPGCKGGMKVVLASDNLREIAREVRTQEAAGVRATVVAGIHALEEVGSAAPVRFEAFAIGIRCGNAFSLGVAQRESDVRSLLKDQPAQRSTFVVVSYR